MFHIEMKPGRFFKNHPTHQPSYTLVHTNTNRVIAMSYPFMNKYNCRMSMMKLKYLLENNNVKDILEIFEEGRSFGICCKNGSIIVSNKFSTKYICKRTIDMLPSGRMKNIRLILT